MLATVEGMEEEEEVMLATMKGTGDEEEGEVGRLLMFHNKDTGILNISKPMLHICWLHDMESMWSFRAIAVRDASKYNWSFEF